ncbi:hypothetical protein F5Y16DRAFT_99678 [Xylariaceae sp. FL0255]|nr:hypothetical protein F5Y16DRAFT_99678 [Xylariaceae sp. FL0255]
MESDRTKQSPVIPIAQTKADTPHSINEVETTTSSTDTYVDIDALPSRSLRKRFTASWASKRTKKEKEGDAKGPVGLRLLRNSPEPLIDLIFVHGLRGGSIKTWRKGDDPRYFWPQFWLPLEPKLRNVNIHTFGYDSNWASTQPSILNVHDFGTSLLEEMRNSPYLRDDGPIILIGHSMGGLVIKKAFVLSQELPDFEKRIRCIFFLATPHQGSDYAAVLNNILLVSGFSSSREYISDLRIGSTSAVRINEEFGKYAYDLPIYSFYETLRTGPGLIVKKDSAVLGPGFRNQRVQYINANHRDICKFESPEDPGYLTLKNALTNATQSILKEVLRVNVAESKEKLQALRSFLGVTDRPAEHHARLEGSCQWINDREDFQDWRDSPEDLPHEEQVPQFVRPSVFWLSANPGTGKSFLAAHIADELSEFGLECAYYFFHFGNKASRSLGDFLRSMAYQMALCNAAVREKLSSLYQEGSTFDKDDARTIWNKIFQKGIFQAQIQTAQYWVVDAIDECSHYNEFFTMLKGLKLTFPFRIFITSRKTSDMHNLQRLLEPSVAVVCTEIEPNDTNNDIKNYVERRASNLPRMKLSGSEDLVTSLLRRANACFLWVRLVLDELETVYSSESIMHVLMDMPEGMIPYYERTTRLMSENKHEKHIAQAALLWVSTSSRSLTISELSQAIEVDIGNKLVSAQTAVEGLCGQLVAVNSETGLVDLVHPTVREFLFSEAAGEFQVSKSEANRRIALACLRILSGSEMQPPRSRRHLSKRPNRTSVPLLQYAISQFSEHVYAASTEDDELLAALHHFFSTNALTWIELTAGTFDLHPLIRCSKNLKGYLVRRAKYQSPLNKYVSFIERWATDLSRVATQFGSAILNNPSSIYYLIPPLCPTSSAIASIVAHKVDGLRVLGHRETVWGDCIASVSLDQDEVASAVSCGERLIAVGLETGDIHLYDVRSCQKENVLHQKHPIDLIHFIDNLIVVSTTRTLILMDRAGVLKWQTRIRYRLVLLTTANRTVIAVSQHGHIIKWDLTTGVLLSDYNYPYQTPEREMDDAPSIKAPDVASISPDMELLALGYRWGTICLHEIETQDIVISVRDSDTNSTPVLLFNPNPNITLLLVVYKQRELVLYDTLGGAIVKRQSTSSVASIVSATCSPDGRTLASVDTHGVLQIWDFESLNLLYQVSTPAASFRTLQFASDGSSIVDMLETGLRVWSPAILVRRNIEEDQSVSDDAPNLPFSQGDYETHRTARITSLCAHPSLPVVFAGKHHGQVVGFNARTGSDMGVFYTHDNAALVRHIAIAKDVIASSDLNGVVQVWTIVAGPNSNVSKGILILKTQFSTQIKQLCFSTRENYLLVSEDQLDTVYSVKDKTCIGIWSSEARERSSTRRWLQVTGYKEKDDLFFLLEDNEIQTISASSFPSCVDDLDTKMNTNIDLNLDADIQTSVINDAHINIETLTLIIEVNFASGFTTASSLFIYDLHPTSRTENRPPLNPLILTKHSKHFIGFNESHNSKTPTPSSSFTFISHDSWLCSADLGALTTTTTTSISTTSTAAATEECWYIRHFFIPTEYYISPALNRTIIPRRSVGDGFVFCVHGELVVVNGGLNFREIVKL